MQKYISSKSLRRYLISYHEKYQFGREKFGRDTEVCYFKINSSDPIHHEARGD